MPDRTCGNLRGNVYCGYEGSDIPTEAITNHVDDTRKCGGHEDSGVSRNRRIPIQISTPIIYSCLLRNLGFCVKESYEKPSGAGILFGIRYCQQPFEVNSGDDIKCDMKVIYEVPENDKKS